MISSLKYKCPPLRADVAIFRTCNYGLAADFETRCSLEIN